MKTNELNKKSVDIKIEVNKSNDFGKDFELGFNHVIIV